MIYIDYISGIYKLFYILSIVMVRRRTIWYTWWNKLMVNYRQWN